MTRWARMIMKFPFGIRLWILIAALFLVAGGTIYGLFSTWHRVQQLEARLTSSQIERFQFAGEVRRELQSLNNSILRYALVRDPQQWTQFEKASSDLDHWIDDHDPSLNPHSPLTTEAEREVIKELNHAYDDYLGSARAVHSNSLPALVNSEQLAQLDAFNTQSERMRDLVRRLTDAHRTAEAAFLANASASLSSLRGILTASVVMLLALVATMGWVIYRDTIAPLRIKLVQSQTLLERQQKLATLGTLAAGIALDVHGLFRKRRGAQSHDGSSGLAPGRSSARDRHHESRARHPHLLDHRVAPQEPKKCPGAEREGSLRASTSAPGPDRFEYPECLRSGPSTLGSCRLKP